MTRQMLIANWYSVLPILFTALLYLIIAIVAFVCGYLVGWNRGTRSAPETLKGEWREEQHKRLVAEERLDTWKKTAKTFEAAMLELTQNKQDWFEQARRELKAVK